MQRKLRLVMRLVTSGLEDQADDQSDHKGCKQRTGEPLPSAIGSRAELHDLVAIVLPAVILVGVTPHSSSLRRVGAWHQHGLDARHVESLVMRVLNQRLGGPRPE